VCMAASIPAEHVASMPRPLPVEASQLNGCLSTVLKGCSVSNNSTTNTKCCSRWVRVGKWGEGYFLRTVL